MKVSLENWTFHYRSGWTQSHSGAVLRSVSLIVSNRALVDWSARPAQTLSDRLEASFQSGEGQCYSTTFSLIGALLMRWRFRYQFTVSWTRCNESSISETSPKDSRP